MVNPDRDSFSRVECRHLNITRHQSMILNHPPAIQDIEKLSTPTDTNHRDKAIEGVEDPDLSFVTFVIPSSGTIRSFTVDLRIDVGTSGEADQIRAEFVVIVVRQYVIPTIPKHFFDERIAAYYVDLTHRV